MDVETAMAAAEQKSGNVIMDGLKGVDNKVKEYKEIDWGPTVSGLYEKRSMKNAERKACHDGGDQRENSSVPWG